MNGMNGVNGMNGGLSAAQRRRHEPAATPGARTDTAGYDDPRYTASTVKAT